MNTPKANYATLENYLTRGGYSILRQTSKQHLLGWLDYSLVDETRYSEASMNELMGSIIFCKDEGNIYSDGSVRCFGLKVLDNMKGRV